MRKPKPLKFFFILPAFFFLFLACKEEAPKKIILEIPVIEVLQKDVPILNDFVGQTYGYNDIAIRARVEGFLVGRNFKEGTFVKKGDLLYSIDPEQFKAKVAEADGRVAAAITELALTKSDLDRIRPLAEINAVAKSDLDAANANYGAAQARLKASRASLRYSQIELGYCSIYSPIDGLIGRTQAKIGDFVGREPNPVVLNGVSRIDIIQVRFSISESKYLQLARAIVDLDKEGNENIDARNEDRANERTKIVLILADGSEYKHLGRFDFSDREVDPSTGTLLLQVSFPNPQNILLPGQFARVRIASDRVKGGLLIPQRSIREVQGQYQTFVIADSNIVELRNISVANKMDSLWLVTSGLFPNEKVVYAGIQKLSPGMTINPKLVKRSSN
jgi:membrane fusion protein, multidrug efflux system